MGFQLSCNTVYPACHNITTLLLDSLETSMPQASNQGNNTYKFPACYRMLTCVCFTKGKS